MNKGMNETKKANKIRIAKFISSKGITSKNEISSSLQISMPTTLQNVKELVEDKIVVESGAYQSTGGRKAKALSISDNIGFAVGMDITNNHITLVLVNMKRQLLERERIRIPFEDSFCYYERMGETLQRFIQKSKIDGKSVAGVGISLPGIVNREEKVLLRSHTLGVSHIGFQNFGQLIGYPFELENDANSAAYAELAQETGNTIYLSLSNTVGGAVFLDGRLYPGENFRSGEFGHMIIEREGRECYCGKKGCADAYCSSKVLQKLTDDSLEIFFRKLKQKNPECVRAWDEYLEYLAIIVTNLRMAFDCKIVLGGYVGGYLDEYQMDLSKKVLKYNNFDYDTAYLKTGKYKLEASAYGITLQFVEKFFESL